MRKLPKKEEYPYMQIDDTLDVGKEPLPILTEKDKEWKKESSEIINKFLKKK